MTEWRTGIDLVREQLRVAAGLPLSVTQEEVEFRGHAIEARISAEDPANRFLPASGTIAALREPSGPGVRVDSGLYDGMSVPLYYDPLLAKLICWGQDREQAIARMRRAIEEYIIAGVRTTMPFHGVDSAPSTLHLWRRLDRLHRRGVAARGAGAARLDDLD